jgi:hypothetical protein
MTKIVCMTHIIRSNASEKLVYAQHTQFRIIYRTIFITFINIIMIAKSKVLKYSIAGNQPHTSVLDIKDLMATFSQ